jgi:nucleotide-binding universal stress UspA family protein
MYKTIVVGTDGSETADKAVDTAARLARDWGAALHIITAYSSGSKGMAEASGAALVGSGGAFHREAAQETAQKAVSKLGDGVSATAHAVGDHPADAIIDTAQSVGADLIVVGSKGMHGARRFLGSVPNSVAHGANCAVLIVKTD